MREDDATTDQLLSAVGKMFAKLVRSDALGHADSASALAQLTETGAAALRSHRSRHAVCFRASPKRHPLTRSTRSAAAPVAVS